MAIRSSYSSRRDSPGWSGCAGRHGLRAEAHGGGEMSEYEGQRLWRDVRNADAARARDLASLLELRARAQAVGGVGAERSE
jgi:hypothetical protein